MNEPFWRKEPQLQFTTRECIGVKAGEFDLDRGSGD
jgi:hypothetical protein